MFETVKFQADPGKISGFTSALHQAAPLSSPIILIVICVSYRQSAGDDPVMFSAVAIWGCKKLHSVWDKINKWMLLGRVSFIRRPQRPSVISWLAVWGEPLDTMASRVMWGWRAEGSYCGGSSWQGTLNLAASKRNNSSFTTLWSAEGF